MLNAQKVVVGRPIGQHAAHVGAFKCTRLFFLSVLVIVGVWATIQWSAFRMMVFHAESYVESNMDNVDQHGDFAFLKLLASSKSHKDEPNKWLAGRLQAQNKKASLQEERRRKWRELMGDNDAELQNNNVLVHPIVHQDVNIAWRTDPPKFIVMRSLVGRGTGSLLHGLLAAHLLGEEFGRIVCVSKAQFPMFHEAFTYVHPMAVQHCPTIYAVEENEEQLAKFTMEDFRITNFDSRPTDECQLKQRLESDADIINLQGNAYPRWPKIPEQQFFFKYYQAKPALLNLLPYEIQQEQEEHPASAKKKLPPPKTVVHLRFPDSELDIREGLEMGCLEALGNSLPNDPSTYVVTNEVDYYDYFAGTFNWGHPNWKLVKHSAKSDFEWGLPLEHDYYKNDKMPPQALMMLELFADWYTLLIAHRVIHTNSEFSASAIHWMGTHSRIYNGINRTHSNDLLLKQEDWILKGGKPRLVDRSPPEIQCNATWAPTPAPIAFSSGSADEKDADEGEGIAQEEVSEGEDKSENEGGAAKEEVGEDQDAAKQDPVDTKKEAGNDGVAGD